VSEKTDAVGNQVPSRWSEEGLRRSTGFVRAYALMAEAASTPDRLVTYGEIGELVGASSGSLMGRVVGIVLGLVTDQERAAGRPMLSAVVVSKTTNRPGPGFYGLATTYGRLPADATEADRIAFWEAELAAVRAAWSA
jgi:hypothetical protein